MRWSNLVVESAVEQLLATEGDWDMVALLSSNPAGALDTEELRDEETELIVVEVTGITPDSANGIRGKVEKVALEVREVANAEGLRNNSGEYKGGIGGDRDAKAEDPVFT